MRKIASAALALSLFMPTAFADESPLPSGKPAGLHEAQYYRDNTVLYVVGIAAIAAGIALAAQSDHHHGLLGGGNGSGGSPSNGGGSSTTTTTTTTN